MNEQMISLVPKNTKWNRVTLPLGVRAALRMYASRISPLSGDVLLKCRLTCATRFIAQSLSAVIQFRWDCRNAFKDMTNKDEDYTFREIETVDGGGPLSPSMKLLFNLKLNV